MFNRVKKFFEDVNPNEINKKMIIKAAERREQALALMPVKQDVAVVDELMQKTKEWLDNFLETSEAKDSFCQLKIKKIVNRWVEPIVVKEDFEASETNRRVYVEMVENKYQETETELAFDKCNVPLDAALNKYLHQELEAFILDTLIFDDESYVYGVKIDLTLHAYDINNESLAEARFEELFRKEPEMACSMSLG